MTPRPSWTRKAISGGFVSGASWITVARSPAAEVFDFLPRSVWPSFLSNSFAFMVFCSCGQVEFPPAQLPKPLHKFGGIGPGQLLCLIGQLREARLQTSPGDSAIPVLLCGLGKQLPF